MIITVKELVDTYTCLYNTVTYTANSFGKQAHVYNTACTNITIVSLWLDTSEIFLPIVT